MDMMQKGPSKNVWRVHKKHLEVDRSEIQMGRNKTSTQWMALETECDLKLFLNDKLLSLLQAATTALTLRALPHPLRPTPQSLATARGPKPLLEMCTAPTRTKGWLAVQGPRSLRMGTCVWRKRRAQRARPDLRKPELPPSPTRSIPNLSLRMWTWRVGRSRSRWSLRSRRGEKRESMGEGSTTRTTTLAPPAVPTRMWKRSLREGSFSVVAAVAVCKNVKCLTLTLILFPQQDILHGEAVPAQPSELGADGLPQANPSQHPAAAPAGGCHPTHG